MIHIFVSDNKSNNVIPKSPENQVAADKQDIKFDYSNCYINNIFGICYFGSFYDVINITTISSNVIVLTFWVHSKYQLLSSRDSSSSIVNKSSLIILIYYILNITLSVIAYRGNDSPKFIIYKEKNFISINGELYDIYNDIQLIINSISFLMMLNFYYICIKDVVLRKQYSIYFKGN